MRRKVKLKSDIKKEGGKITKFLFYLLSISFLGVSFYILFFSGYLAITEIAVSGQENIQADDVKKEIEAQLGGQIFHSISKNNMLLARTSSLKEDLKKKFKKIDSVKIKRGFPSKLVIEISEKKLKMIFCSREKCFILDEKGNAFEEIREDSEEYKNSSLFVLRDASDPEVSLEERMFNPAYMDFMESAKNKMEQEMDIFLEREYMTPNRISGDIRVKTKEGWDVYFDAGLEAKKEVMMLKAVLDEKIPRDQRGNLEYIDLRSDNRVFYKFKDGSQEEIKPEEEKKPEEQVKGEEKKKKKK